MSIKRTHFLHHFKTPLILPLLGFVMVVVLVGLAAGMSLLNQNQNLGSKAAPATTLGMTTATTTLNPNQIFTVNIEAKTNANLVKAIDLSLHYDKTALEMVKLEKGAFAAPAQELINSINAAAGMASYTVIMPTNANPPYLNGQGVVAKATFKALKVTDSTKISFSPDETTVGAQNESTDAVSLHTDLTLKITDGTPAPTPTTIPSNAEFFIYSYEACLNSGSNGDSTYIVWNVNRYPNIKSIDISLNANFSEFANKDVASPKALPNGFAMTDGTNFRWFNSNKGLLRFEPDTTYYVRMFYDNRHSAVATYNVPKCAGRGGSTYKQCNESCTNNDECAANLYCYNSQCRRINNPDNNSCVLPPDQGIKRGCNEYCSDNNECASGLSCWYNRCRVPEKTSDTSCSTWNKPTTTSCNKYCADTSECSDGLTCWYNRCRNEQNHEDVACRSIVKPGVVEGCNASCTINADCGANLRCYNNQCRLLTNPGDTACQPPKPTRRATPVSDKGSGGWTDDEDAVTPTARPTSKPATSSATPTVAPQVTIKLNVSPSPKVSGKPTSKPTAKPTTSKLVNDFPDKTDTPDTTTKAKSPFSAVPLILGIIIVAVAAVLGIPRLLAMLQANSGQSLVQPPLCGGSQPSTPITPVTPSNPVAPMQPSQGSPLNTKPQNFGRPVSENNPPGQT